MFRQIDKLYPNLTPEQKERADKADVKARGTRLGHRHASPPTTSARASVDDAAERERRHANELKDLAAALQALPADKLAAPTPPATRWTPPSRCRSR